MTPYPMPPEKRRPDPTAGLVGSLAEAPRADRDAPAVAPPPFPEPAPVKWPKLALLKILTSWLTGGFPKPTDKTYQPMKLKPGIQTSELWVVIGSGLISTALAVAGLVEGTYVALGVTVLGSLYALIRGGLKSKAQ